MPFRYVPVSAKQRVVREKRREKFTSIHPRVGSVLTRLARANLVRANRLLSPRSQQGLNGVHLARSGPGSESSLSGSGASDFEEAAGLDLGGHRDGHRDHRDHGHPHDTRDLSRSLSQSRAAGFLEAAAHVDPVAFLERLNAAALEEKRTEGELFDFRPLGSESKSALDIVRSPLRQFEAKQAGNSESTGSKHDGAGRKRVSRYESAAAAVGTVNVAKASWDEFSEALPELLRRLDKCVHYLVNDAEDGGKARPKRLLRPRPLSSKSTKSTKSTAVRSRKSCLRGGARSEGHSRAASRGPCSREGSVRCQNAQASVSLLSL